MSGHALAADVRGGGAISDSYLARQELTQVRIEGKKIIGIG